MLHPTRDHEPMKLHHPTRTLAVVAGLLLLTTLTADAKMNNAKTTTTNRNARIVGINDLYMFFRQSLVGVLLRSLGPLLMSASFIGRSGPGTISISLV